MGDLFSQVRDAVAGDRFLVGVHADERIRERSLAVWYVVDGLAEGRLLCEHPRRTPNPTVEVVQALPDGTAYKAVWAWLAQDRVAKLVTVQFVDRSVEPW